VGLSFYNRAHLEKMDRAYLTVYLKGYDAFVKIGDEAKSPYYRMSWARNEWRNGFLDAKTGKPRPQ
jgi:hypothetical protein